MGTEEFIEDLSKESKLDDDEELLGVKNMIKVAELERRYKKALVEKEKILEEKDKKLKEKDKKLKQKDKILKEKDMILKEKDKILKEKEKEIQRLKRMLKEKQG